MYFRENGQVIEGYDDVEIKYNNDYSGYDNYGSCNKYGNNNTKPQDLKVIPTNDGNSFMGYTGNGIYLNNLQGCNSYEGYSNEDRKNCNSLPIWLMILLGIILLILIIMTIIVFKKK